METIITLADFRIAYRFFTLAEGGRKNLPLQGYRPNWVYAEDYSIKDHISPSNMPIFLINPIFIDENGLSYDIGETLPQEGFADMRIMFNQLRSEHRRRIKIGTKGYLVEGPNRVAEATVIDILYLNHNEHEQRISF